MLTDDFRWDVMGQWDKKMPKSYEMGISDVRLDQNGKSSSTSSTCALGSSFLPPAQIFQAAKL